jgi:hypothetical protein
MEPMKWEFTIADLIAWVLAIGAGGWSLFTWWKGNKDRQREKREAYLAFRIEGRQVRATTGSRPFRTEHWLVIENKSKAEARQIKVFIDDKPIGEHPYGGLCRQPIDTIGPLDSFTCRVTLVSGVFPSPSKLRITWTDDSGRHERVKAFSTE